MNAVNGGPVVQSYTTRRSRAAHVAVLAVGWVVFSLLWWRVLQRPGSLEGVGGAVTLVLFMAIVVGLVTWAWIAHNVALARRRGGRNSIVELRLPTADGLGRELAVAPGAATASYVVVRVDGPVKSFVSGSQARD